MPLIIEPYSEQVKHWPKTGRHILAQYDDESIVVYQAYRRAIAAHAVHHGQFGGEFSYSRMSWIKPNFLWMMFRSGWGTKPDQDATLAIRIRRTFFDDLLAQAVPSSWDPNQFATHEEWRRAVGGSNVRLQWDPDHLPNGAPLQRRAIQLGLRGEALDAYGRRDLLEVIDLSDFVEAQRAVLARAGVEAIQMPRETAYIPSDPETVRRLGLSLAPVT